MKDILENIKAASVRLVGGGASGTGYVVAPQRIATCEHVIKKWGKDRYSAFIGPAQVKREAYVLKSDAQADCAIVAFDEPINVQPLPLADSLERKAVWDGYGYPEIAKEAGLPITGVVLDPNSFDDTKQATVLLVSDMVAAGQASPLHGFSGSPVLVNGAVIGHFKKHLGDPDDRRRAAFGMVYACPVAAVRALLDVPATMQAIAPSPITSFDTSIPQAAATDYHVFVSYRSTDRKFALRLVDRLEGTGLRVFIDQKELLPGDYLAQQLQDAMSRSHAAVLLVSKDWLAAPWCQQEANVLVKRAVEDPKFRLVPIRIDDCKMPDLLDSRLWLDFNGVSLENNEARIPVMDKLLWGLIGKQAPVDANSTTIAKTETEAVQKFIVRICAAAKTEPQRVFNEWKDWKLSGLKDQSPALVAAEKLIGQVRPDLALQILDDIGTVGVRARQLRGLALAKSNKLDDAVQQLEILRAEMPLDPETNGILAGAYKKLWLKSKKRNRAYLQSSYETYRQAYEETHDTYNGINVASMAHWVGKHPYGRDVAAEVRKILEGKPEAKRDHWEWATLGEAFLLSERDAEARASYGRAVAEAAGLHRDISVMRGGARLDLEGLGRKYDEFDDIFPVPRVVAFFGHMTDVNRPIARFPDTKIGAVRDAIRAKLDAIPGEIHAFSSAARGSDIIFLEEVLDRAGRCVVILPLPETDFFELSCGGDWTERFLTMRSRVELYILTETRPADVAMSSLFEETNKEVQRRVIDYARELNEKPIVIAVWDGKPGDGRGGTADAVQRWRADLYVVDVIDPHLSDAAKA